MIHHLWKSAAVLVGICCCGPLCVASPGSEKANPQESAALRNAGSQQITLAQVKLIEARFADIDPSGPGAAVCVCKNGSVIYKRGFGLANLKSGAPVTTKSIFDLASCSKQFTSMAVLKLVEDGQLSLDDPVSRYLPELGPTANGICLHNLLSMTSGLCDYSAGWSEEQLATKLPVNVLRWTARHPLKFKAGACDNYNNGNYALLSMIVERVARQPFAEFLQSKIFLPAGMLHTCVLTRPGQQIAVRVGGYKTDQGKFKWTRLDTSIVGDGQVMTSVEDLALWDKALLHSTLISPGTLDQAFTRTTLENGKRTQYGMGWEITHEFGEKVVFHSGSWAGTATYIARYLKSGLTVIVLSNNENYPCDVRGTDVAAIFLK